MDQSKAEDEAFMELRALIEARAEAVRTKDVAKAGACIASDVVLFDVVNPPQYQGSEALTQRTEQWFSSFEGPLEFEVEDLKITASGDIGFSHSFNRVKGNKTDGQKLEMQWRSTTCYCKTEAGWKVIHEHNSVPFIP
jgi:ketosteroid isomerase-like protein